MLPQRLTGAKARSLAISTLALALLATGPACSGSEKSQAGPDAAANAAESDAIALLSPTAFAKEMADPSAVLINVHVPYEGELDGTDAFIPYTEIVGHPDLPTDPNTKLLIYCRSGRMSAIATEALREAGYTDLTDLAGGMVAWQDEGRALIQSSQQ